jgi:hypothetical protein
MLEDVLPFAEAEARQPSIRELIPEGRTLFAIRQAAHVANPRRGGSRADLVAVNYDVPGAHFTTYQQLGNGPL